MLNWIKRLFCRKKNKLPTKYKGLLKSDMLYEVDTFKYLLGQIRSSKQSFDGIDDNIVLQLVLAEAHIENAIEFLNEGMNDCVDDAMEDGDYPVFMGWNKD